MTAPAVGGGVVPTPKSRRAPRVLFLTHTGRIGGAETCLLAIAPAFAAPAGASSILLFQDGALRDRLNALGMEVLLARKPLDLRAIRRDGGLLRTLPRLGGMAGLVRQIRTLASRHDLIYCNSQKSFVLGALASRTGGAKLLWHLHDILDRSHFGRAQIALVVALANRRAARVVAPSQAVADAFVAAGGCASLVTVVPNGVPPPRVVRGADARAALRQGLGLPEGFVFGVFSRLAPWKGQHIALDALALLPDATCIIAGCALFGEDDYGRVLHAQAARLGVASRVRFLGHREDVPTLMQAVDVVVHPSIDPEPFGLTLVEAMLAATPVIASRAGAAAEILDGGQVGTLVPPGDASALAVALARVRAQPERLAPVVAAARLRAERHYGVERLRGDIGDIVRAVVDR
ncbi:glycosyltransferase [Lichenicoccus sp.]|uniref:glycosyltransferase n=1 Tax=Lichenicoccus sp. TaxID=2781899 RepID=UPI003D0EBA80